MDNFENYNKSKKVKEEMVLSRGVFASSVQNSIDIRTETVTEENQVV